ncbi:hypothetical protein [Umezawaea sp.]|uniref:hypothetical protein n=1 Tax=Umezawaea sp. TaxID=1955258 RepID=UPI002ED14F00
MSDPLDFPPPRPLPETVRDRARRRLSEGMADPHRPTRRAPVVIAAAVVLLAGAGAVVTRDAAGGGAAATAPATSSPVPAPPPDLHDQLHARDGWAPPDVVDRCAAVAGDLPPKEGWTPLVTSVVHGTTLSAFSTGPDGVFFCETTPASVSVSRPAAPDTGGAPASIRFLSSRGSVAGFVRPGVEQLRLHAPGATTAAFPVVTGDVFLTPEGFRGVEDGVVFTVGRDQEFPARDLPRPSEPTVDRPRPGGDRASEAGRRLGACLDAGPDGAPDPANWTPGAHAGVGAHGGFQLGRYGDLLGACATREDGSPFFDVIDLADLTGTNATDLNLVGRSVWAAVRLHDFRSTPTGGTVADAFTYAGLVLDDRVATITLTRAGFPDAVAVVENGTFVLGGPATTGSPSDFDGAAVVVRDAAGAVVEELPVGR